jgi:spoIIIJ-associated protein
VEWVEASGKSLPEAKETVLDLLGVAEDDAEFVVLSEPKAGLFGRLRGEARVQARVRPKAPPPKRGRRPKSDRPRSGGSSSRGGGGGGTRTDRSGGSSGSGRQQKKTNANGSGPDGSSANGVAPEIEDGDSSRLDADGTVPTTNGSGSSTGASRRRRGSRGRGGGEQAKQGRGGKLPEESEVSMEESLTLEQQGDAAKGFLAGLVQEFGLDADVTFTEVDEDTVQVAATGSDLGLLVGPRGATLAAIQDLTRTFVQRQSESRTDRILVDVAGYREKRVAALRRFTEGLTEEVKESGEERALEPMSPADRKVVHDAVNEIDGVETRSEGVEPTRYVVIEPSG